MARYIDADAYLKKVCTYNETGCGSCRFQTKCPADEPTIDAVPVKRGKWITEECLPGVAVCSICGHEIRGIGCQYTNYCDECGARMEERKEE